MAAALGEADLYVGCESFRETSKNIKKKKRIQNSYAGGIVPLIAIARDGTP